MRLKETGSKHDRRITAGGMSSVKALRIALILLLLLPVGLWYAGEVTSTDSEDCFRADVFSSPPRIITPRGDPTLEWSDKILPVGEVNGTYKISTPEQLAWVASQVNGGSNTFKDKTIELTRDIDLSARNWSPIGKTYNQQFKGSIDGKGFRITGLTVSSTSGYAGLIGNLSHDDDVSIKNLHIVGASVSSAYTALGTYAGVLVGKASLSGKDLTIDSCTVSGTLTLGGSVASLASAGAGAGALVGDVDADDLKIEKCISRVGITVDMGNVSSLDGPFGVGALVGRLDAKLEAKYNANYGAVTVNGAPQVLGASSPKLGIGSAVGYSSSTGDLKMEYFYNCSNGAVKIVDSSSNSFGGSYAVYGGGVVGYHSGKAVIKYARNMAAVNLNCTSGGSGTDYFVGGILGGCPTSSYVTEINHAFSRGDITLNTGTTTNANAYVGGIIGDAQNVGTKIAQCYSYGNLSLTSGASNQGRGGLIGKNTNNNYDNVEKSAWNNCGNSVSTWGASNMNTATNTFSGSKSDMHAGDSTYYGSAGFDGAWIYSPNTAPPDLKMDKGVDAVYIRPPATTSVAAGGGVTLYADPLPDIHFIEPSKQACTWSVGTVAGARTGGSDSFLSWTGSGNSVNITTNGIVSTATVRCTMDGKTGEVVLDIKGTPSAPNTPTEPSSPPSPGTQPSSQPVTGAAGSEDRVGYTRSDDVSPTFPTQVLSSSDVYSKFIAANEILASSDVTVYLGSEQRPMTDLPKEAVIVETLDNVELEIKKPVAEVLPVCFIPSGKDALELTADLRNSATRSGGVTTTKKALLPMTYVVKISRSEAAPLFGSKTDAVFSSPLNHLDEIFKYYVIQTEIKQGERYGWFTRLVRGIMTPADAVAKGVLKVEASQNELTLKLFYYVMDGPGEAFVKGNYLIVPDGSTDRVIKDPVWLNKWSKACNPPAASSGGGGGCSTGFGVAALFAALGTALYRRP